MLKLEDLNAGRFAILRHDHPFLHWDFLLEHHTSAATWRLLSAPGSGHCVMAERISDHRLLYLHYEGPVSGNRGTVLRLWSGDYSVIRPQDTCSEDSVLLRILLLPGTMEHNNCLRTSLQAELRQTSAGILWCFDSLVNAA